MCYCRRKLTAAHIRDTVYIRNHFYLFLVAINWALVQKKLKRIEDDNLLQYVWWVSWRSRCWGSRHGQSGPSLKSWYLKSDQSEISISDTLLHGFAYGLRWSSFPNFKNPDMAIFPIFIIFSQWFPNVFPKIYRSLPTFVHDLRLLEKALTWGSWVVVRPKKLVSVKQNPRYAIIYIYIYINMYIYIFVYLYRYRYIVIWYIDTRTHQINVLIILTHSDTFRRFEPSFP